MEKILSRISAPFTKKTDTDFVEDPEELWLDLEDVNENELENLTEAVAGLNEKVKSAADGSEAEESFEEEFEDDDEQSFGVEEDEDELDFDDIVHFDNLDPKEQLRLLMKPVEEEHDLSDEDDEEDNFDDVSDEENADVKKVSFDILNEDESDADMPQSNFERQQARLKRTIAQLEAENVAEKDWTLRGEVNATRRPVDSLLQEDLEFEHVGKLAPTVTVEVTESLESIIMKRIKDAAWDDVERMPEDMVIEQKKKMLADLDDTKAKKSLAEQYEADFQASQQKKQKVVQGDLKDGANVDPETKAKHNEIRKLFGKLCKSIDELSDNKFASRTYEMADVEIKTLKN